jgi:acetyl esterase/lipase
LRFGNVTFFRHPWFWMVGFLPALGLIVGFVVMAARKGRDVTVYRDIPYLSGNAHLSQRLDVYLPPKVGPDSPVLVLVHGGAWISGTKTAYEPIARNFAQQGFVAIVPEYRLSPEVRHPAHVDDVRAALKWTVAQAQKYGYGSRVALMGHSAGAYIGAALAADPGDLPAGVPGAFVGLAGIYDLPALDKRWPGYDQWFLEKAFGARGPGWKAASPAHTPFKNKSPWIVVHGEADELADTEQSKAFARHLETQGISVKLILQTGVDHFGVLRDLGSARNPLTETLLPFLR